MMKQQEVLRKIGTILTELNEQYQYLAASEEHLNDFEIELFAANAKFLTDHADVLKKITGAPVNKVLPLAQQDDPPQHDAQQTPPALPAPKEPEPANTIPVALPAAFMQETPPAPVPEPAGPLPAEASPTWAETAPIAETVPEVSREVAQSVENEPVPNIDLGGQQDTYSYVRQAPEPVEEHTFHISSSRTSEEPVPPAAGLSALGMEEPSEPLKPVVAAEERPAQPGATDEPAVLTLNQRFSAQTKVNPAPVTAPAARPVSDLKAAISLNDKLLFVRDLFNGYNLAFNEAVELLNRCKTFEEADRMLKANYVTKNDWPAKQSTADKFYALLHRRFA